MITPQEILTELVQLRDGIDNGTYARDAKTRILSKRLGNMLTLFELARESRQLPAPGDMQPTVDTVITEARRVLTEVLERLARSTH